MKIDIDNGSDGFENQQISIIISGVLALYVLQYRIFELGDTLARSFTVRILVNVVLSSAEFENQRILFIIGI